VAEILTGITKFAKAVQDPPTMLGDVVADAGGLEQS
jgi:hypothetical protein